MELGWEPSLLFEEGIEETVKCFFENHPSFLTLKEGYSKIIPSFFTIKEGSTFLTKPLFPQGREGVAGSAIAPPEFWSASGACALKGWLGVLTQSNCDY